MADSELSTYYKLRPGKGFLKGIDVGDDIDLADIVEAEAWAKADIDEILQKRWPNDLALIPETIQRLAHMLAASYVLDIVHRNDKEHVGCQWRKEAISTLLEIKQGKRGIKLVDGSWDVDYTGNSNPEHGSTNGFRIISI